jgi:hypothetical protein
MFNTSMEAKKAFIPMAHGNLQLGEVLYSEIFNGEIVDARREQGLDKSGF